MIRRLELSNFRRHADTALEFTPDEQLVVISGHNGAGKSTLISEALLFAFFGESRHGRRRLDELVRRGAELEGVEVSVTFEASGRTWRVDRRRVEGIGSARLWVDGTILVDGTSAVDAEITKLLGMDAAGFRLAVLARQKELDGLTSLDRSTRRRVLGRLLRIDAVGRASARANDEYLRAAEILNAFGAAPDLEALAAELEAARGAAQAAHRARDDAQSEVARLEAAAAQTADADRRASEAEARAAAAAAAAQEAASTAAEITERAAAARAAHRALGDPQPPARSSQDVDAQRARIAATLEGAEAARRAAEDRRVLERDLAEACAARDELVARLEELVDVDERLASARELAKGARAVAAAARDELEVAAKGRAVAEAALRDAQRRLAEFSEVGEGVCERCGSTLDAEHLAVHADELSDAALAAHGRLEEAKAAEEAARAAFDDADRAFQASVESGRAVAAEAEERDRARTEMERVNSRIKVLESRLAAPAPVVPDTDQLTSELASLDAEVEAARAAEAAVTEAARAAALAERLESEAAAARRRADELADAAEAAAVPAEVLEARARNAEVVAALVEARERLADAREAAATADGAVTEAERRLAEATEASERRAERETRARLAAHTKVLLRDCHERLSEGLRPALEVSATQLLARLSEGRFPAVRVTGDYDIMVSDDGEFRSLGELSGGEVDLVALAVRLALAQVVAERRGSDALGLLVLDEVFGSQDASRRSAILSALRELRTIYGQIFLISHVGGLEDAADRVVDLQLNDERVAVAAGG